MQPGRERRRAKRVGVDGIHLKVVKLGVQPVNAVHKALDVSAGGARFLSSIYLTLKDRVVVHLVLGHEFSCNGIVRRVIAVESDGRKLQEVGVEFINMTPELRTALDGRPSI